MRSKNQKIKLLRIWEILRTESDEEHTFSTNQLVECLADEGIEAERKAIYDDIRTLVAAGYPVECKRTRVNEYFVRDTGFSSAEVRMLLDSVQAANFVSEPRAKQMTYKIAALAGSNKGELLAHNTLWAEGKRKDDAGWENILLVSRAIERKRSITFRYFDYDVNKQQVYRMRFGDNPWYRACPRSLICREDNYYLVATMGKATKYFSFRLDRMADVSFCEKKWVDPEWMKDYPVSKYRKETFGMFAGEKERVSLLCVEKPSVIDIVLDKFGFDTPLHSRGDGTFSVSVVVQLSPVFWGWLLSVADIVTLYSPKARAQYLAWLEQAAKALQGNT